MKIPMCSTSKFNSDRNCTLQIHYKYLHLPSCHNLTNRKLDQSRPDTLQTLPLPCGGKQYPRILRSQTLLDVSGLVKCPHGCILWESHSVIPLPNRYSILEELHVGHPGTSRMKNRPTVLFGGQELTKRCRKLSKYVILANAHGTLQQWLLSILGNGLNAPALVFISTMQDPISVIRSW